MNDNEADTSTILRAVLIAIDEATRARPVETIKILAALGSAGAFIVGQSVKDPDAGSDIMGEMVIAKAYRDGLAALRTATPPEPIPLRPRKPSRSGGKR